jgi:hypothetical protein
MALPVERLSAEELMGERAERRTKAAMMPAGTPGQRLLRDTALAWIKARELAEDVLLSDRAALTAEDGPTVRVVAAKRKLVELNVKMAARMKVACVEGLEFAGKIFEVQHLDVEGLTEEEVKVLRAQKKEAEKKKEEGEEKKTNKEARYKPYQRPMCDYW